MPLPNFVHFALARNSKIWTDIRMNRQIIFLLVFVLVLGSIGYLWYGYSRTAQPAEGLRTESSLGTRLSELRRLTNLQLDISLFQDPFFKSLQVTESVAEEKSPGRTNAGRENPFLPF